MLNRVLYVVLLIFLSPVRMAAQTDPARVAREVGRVCAAFYAGEDSVTVGTPVLLDPVRDAERARDEMLALSDELTTCHADSTLARERLFDSYARAHDQFSVCSRHGRTPGAGVWRVPVSTPFRERVAFAVSMKDSVRVHSVR